MAQRHLSLKLLVDSKDQRVLFAEAQKDTIDFLFGLLSLPVGTVARLLSSYGMVGSLGKLYDSVERIGVSYLQAGFDRNLLLQPTTSSNTSCQNAFLLLKCPQSSVAKKYLRCDGSTEVSYGITRSSCNNYVTDVPGTYCPSCKRQMKAEMTYVSKKPETAVVYAGGGGYVKGVVVYKVMDDLAVEPMSTISSITLLNKFHIKEVALLEERTVDLGMEEGLRLLKASLQSKTVLTDVFLGRRAS